VLSDLFCKFAGRDEYERSCRLGGRGLVSEVSGDQGEKEEFESQTCFLLRIESRTGSKYARVFPEPVLALAKMSLPSRAKGIALAWTGVGVWKFCFRMP